MRNLRALPFLAVLRAMLLSACGVTTGSAPTLTPDPALPVTAAAMFPTRVPTAAPTPTPVARSDDSELIARLLGNIENAILTRNLGAYRSYVDLTTDPIFGLEHTRWIEDMETRVRILRFDLTMRNLTIDGNEAHADLNMSWSQLTNTTVSYGADFPILFRRGTDGQWRYAGEDWTTVIETDHFRVKALPGLEGIAAGLPDVLPGVYDAVTAALDYTPEGISEIKLYDNPWVLIATTRLSITTPITGWNEPGEALKLLVEDEQPPTEALLAHEYAHFVLFDLAGTTRGEWPWWVSEGASQYAASRFWTLTDCNRVLATVNQARRTTGLPDWLAISSFEETPESQWHYAYEMGYAFLRFVEDTHDHATLTAWLHAMATDDLETATQAVLGMSFADANTAFLAWLDDQPGAS